MAQSTNQIVQNALLATNGKKLKPGMFVSYEGDIWKITKLVRHIKDERLKIDTNEWEAVNIDGHKETITDDDRWSQERGFDEDMKKVTGGPSSIGDKFVEAITAYQMTGKGKFLDEAKKLWKSGKSQIQPFVKAHWAGLAKKLQQYGINSDVIESTNSVVANALASV